MKWLILGASLALVAPARAAQDTQERPRAGDILVVQDSLKPGLVGQYFYMGKEIKRFPAAEIAGEKPKLRRVDGQVCFDVKDGCGFEGLEWTEFFAVVWTGVLRVPKDGKVTLYLKSDDGSKLFLDGKEIVDNDGKHRMDEDSKTVELTRGDHELKIEYFQNRDKAGCVLSWKLEDADKEVVPASALWHRFEKELDAK
jgi:hypothetical protein